VRQVLGETCASAVYAAVLRLLGDVEEEDLAVDVVHTAGAVRIWITETTMGGAGALERVQRSYQDDPRRFWRLVLNSLAPADLELVDVELTRFLDRVVNEPAGALAEAVDRARHAGDNASLRRAFDEMLGALRGHGGRVTHAVTSSLAARPLRPGWTRGTDEQVHRIYAARRRLERRFSVEVDERTWSHLFAKRDDLRGPEDALTARQVYALLWPSSGRAHNRHLALPALYGERPPVDRRLLLDLLPQTRRTIQVTPGEDWTARATTALQEDGSVDLLARPSAQQELRRGVLAFLSSPLEVGYLLLHPVLRGVVGNDSDQVRVSLELQEAEQ
jgi:hypothetical protein